MLLNVGGHDAVDLDAQVLVPDHIPQRVVVECQAHLQYQVHLDLFGGLAPVEEHDHMSVIGELATPYLIRAISRHIPPHSRCLHSQWVLVNAYQLLIAQDAHYAGVHAL